MLIAAGADVDGDVVAECCSAPTRRCASSRCERSPGARALAPADVPASGLPARLRGDPADASAWSRSRRGAHRRHRLSDAGAIHDRRDGAASSARPARDAQSCSPRISTTAGTIFRCTRPSCRSCTRRCATLRGARPHAVDYLVADAPAGVTPRAGNRDAAPPRGGGAATRTIAVNVDPRESDSARMSADDFQAAVTRLKEAGGVRGARRGAQQEDRQHLWQYALVLLLAMLLAARGVVASEDGVKPMDAIYEPIRSQSLLIAVRARWRALCLLQASVRGALRGRGILARCARCRALDRRRAGRADGARRGRSVAARRRRAGLCAWAAAARAVGSAGGALHRGARARARRSSGHRRRRRRSGGEHGVPALAEHDDRRRGAARRARSTSTRSSRASRCGAPASRRPPALLALGVVLFAARGPARQAVDAASLTLFPARVTLDVTPGQRADRSRASPLAIEARLVGNRAPVIAQVQIARRRPLASERDDAATRPAAFRARAAVGRRRRSSTVSSPAR